ncbi:MAG: polyhydroxyalkanoic acid system family protein [Myxococcota bacterium]
MRYTVEHELPLADVRARAELAFAAYRVRYGRLKPEFAWQSEHRATARCRLRGIEVRGELELEPGSIVVSVALPGLLRRLEGRAASLLGRETEAWLRCEVA